MKYDLYSKHGVKYLKKEKYMFVKQIDKRMNASAIRNLLNEWYLKILSKPPEPLASTSWKDF